MSSHDDPSGDNPSGDASDGTFDDAFDGTFDDIAAELTALAGFLDAPNPPPADVAAAVRARLEPGRPTTDAPDPEATRHTPAPAPVRRTPARLLRRRRWQVVTAIVLVVIAITAATPQGRAAVATILRLAGIEITLGATTPTPIATPTPLPGERVVALESLAGQVGFPIKVPAELGDPQYATVSDNGRVASMFWPGGIRLDQFDGSLSPYFFKKVGPPWPEEITVAGVTGWWLGGEHPLGYITRDDDTAVPLRQAKPTLIWQSGALCYRLEGAGGKERAVQVANSLR
ncbi:hypothetical protein [Nonomuraea rhizosphaerae]|uniref:hypothetical protein n=1 Tax=Nonomuraea rhizosphaerae TaxID=2665663 RepID=UPI001C5E1045|nr:hypothetical protein [Nonomuraea rhizosphaerae]